jgi:CRISPR-associated protein Cas1
MEDLHLLPKVRDSWSYLYVEHARIDQESKAIAIQDAHGKTPVPATALTLLMLGPGTTITHAAINVLAKHGCLVAWTGEGAVRMYAQGMGETRASRRTLWQAWQWADERRRLGVVMRMYRMRFNEALNPGLTLRQIRGREGVRVREAYAQASRATGVPWTGRAYSRVAWTASDPVNRALSAANSCLYGVCHAAIVSAGYSPAIGFIHTGKMLSFVYDIADLYKAELTIPVAFQAVQAEPTHLEREVRWRCRDAFHQSRLLARVVDDIDRALGARDDDGRETGSSFDLELAAPGELWDPEGTVPGGENYGDPEEGLHDDGADVGAGDSEPAG